MTSRSIRAFLAIAFWAAAIFSIWLTMAPVVPNVVGGDKVQHVAVFALLTLLLWVAYPRLPVGWRGGCLLAIGATIELLQGALPFGRSADFLDFTADALGIGASAFFEFVVGKMADAESK